jgi:hypothetical protein
MKQLSKTMRAYLLLAFIYLISALTLPPSKSVMHQYNLSANQYHMLLFAVLLPQTLIWLAAFYGYGQLKRYSNSIKKTADGNAFEKFTHGARWLAWGLAIPAIIGQILEGIANVHPGFKPSGVIIDNYIALSVPVIAFTMFGNGSRLLVKHAKLHITSNALRMILMAFVILGVIYCYLTFRQLDLRDTMSTDNPFYLPTWLMVLTITIPYLYAWCTGLLAAYEIGLVGKRTQGVLYRKSLQIFALGIVLVLAGSIVLQYVTSIEPRTLHLSLNGLLLTSYVLKVVAGVGYLVIARGANRLRMIEEV